MDETQSPAVPTLPPRVGERLAEARTAQGLSLDDVAARTRVPVRHLEAIESGEHASLPAATYSVGFVRTYAKTLGLDAAALAQDFRAEIGQRPSAHSMVDAFEPADPARLPTRLLTFIALALAVLLAIGYAIWRGGAVTGDSAADRARLATGTDRETAPSAPAAPASAPGAADTARAASATGPVTLTATDTVWLRVYEKNGERLLEKQMQAGESWQVPATAREPEILTGRPQALRITVGATVIPPLGPPEHRISDVSLAPQALLARLSAPTAQRAAPTSQAAPASQAPRTTRAAQAASMAQTAPIPAAAPSRVAPAPQTAPPATPPALPAPSAQE